MNRFTKQFGKPICVVLYGIFAGLAAKKKPLPLVILLLLHTAEFFLVGRKVAEDHAISTPSALANCLAFGFTWWKPIRDHF